MFNIIQDTYKLYFRKLPVWALFVLPLVLYSVADDYLRVYFADCRFYIYLSVVLSPVVYAAVELAVYKYMLKAELGKVWGTLKKLVLFAVIQFAAGFVMMLPMFVFSRTAGHHQLGSLWIPFGLVANIFLGIWFFARINIILPMIVKGDKITLKSFDKQVKNTYAFWAAVAALIYFPYIASYYLIGNSIVNVLVAGFLSVLQPLFNSLYYQAKNHK